MSTISAIDVYEGPLTYVLVGHDGPTRRLLHVHRRPPDQVHDGHPPLPPVEEEPRTYTAAECAARLAEITSDTALILVMRATALLGMVRFVEGWYLLLVTRHEVAGVIGGHSIHRIEETAMLAITAAAAASEYAASSVALGSSHSVGSNASPAPASTKPSNPSLVRGGKRLLAAAASGLATRLQLTGWVENWAETKYKSLFSSIDLTRDFYFSYTYDLTNTLQVNMRAHPMSEGGDASSGTASSRTEGVEGSTGDQSGSGDPATTPGRPPVRDKFIWNHYLAFSLIRMLRTTAWVPPIVHGFFLQLGASIIGRSLVLTLIGRRSRLYAGARLLKRGLNEAGHVANEVEVEQIAGDGARGSLHQGGLCSAVQLRGSIPLVWGHGDQKHMVPRPDIHLQRIDPAYEFTQRHFDELYERSARRSARPPGRPAAAWRPYAPLVGSAHPLPPLPAPLSDAPSARAAAGSAATASRACRRLGCQGSTFPCKVHMNHARARLRYQGPVFVFDLIRQSERRHREMILGKGLSEALTALQACRAHGAHGTRVACARHAACPFGVPSLPRCQSRFGDPSIRRALALSPAYAAAHAS